MLRQSKAWMEISRVDFRLPMFSALPVYLVRNLLNLGVYLASWKICSGTNCIKV
jgi:hypothetical protein